MQTKGSFRHKTCPTKSLGIERTKLKSRRNDSH